MTVRIVRLLTMAVLCRSSMTVALASEMLVCWKAADTGPGGAVSVGASELYVAPRCSFGVLHQCRNGFIPERACRPHSTLLLVSHYAHSLSLFAQIRTLDF